MACRPGKAWRYKVSLEERLGFLFFLGLGLGLTLTHGRARHRTALRR